MEDKPDWHQDLNIGESAEVPQEADTYPSKRELTPSLARAIVERSILNTKRAVHQLTTEMPKIEKFGVHERQAALDLALEPSPAETSRPLDGSNPSELETVLHKVYEAAEHNEPMEQLYERRGEVKDDPATSSRPVSVGAVMASALGQYQSGTASSLGAVKSMQRAALQQTSQISQLSPMYKKAIRQGFGVAVAVIVIAIIFYLAR